VAGVGIKHIAVFGGSSKVYTTNARSLPLLVNVKLSETGSGASDHKNLARVLKD
jgi:hypothetical protein